MWGFFNHNDKDLYGSPEKYLKISVFAKYL